MRFHHTAQRRGSRVAARGAGVGFATIGFKCPISASSGGNECCFIAGDLGKRAMKTLLLGAVVAITSTLAHAEDMAEMISRYRHTHGLSTVKTDPQLTAIAERQAKAMAASGIMDHNVAGSFTARISGVRTSMAAENIAAGTKTWEETFRMVLGHGDRGKAVEKERAQAGGRTGNR
jgi:hypothetical protein